jgi:Rv0078B-related antitoxin
MSDDLHPVQVEAFRRMTPGQRLEVAMGFIEEMRELRRSILRQEHPDWTEKQIANALREFVLHASS